MGLSPFLSRLIFRFRIGLWFSLNGQKWPEIHLKVKLIKLTLARRAFLACPTFQLAAGILEI